MTMSATAPSPAMLQAAANWHLDLQAAPRCNATCEAHRRWLEADTAHRQAWGRMQRLQGTLDGLPADARRLGCEIFLPSRC